MVFGTQGYPTVAAVGGGKGGSGGSATLVYPCGGVASVSVPSVGFEFDETFNIRGSEGIVTLHTPGHCPTKVTVNGDTFEYPLVPYPYFDGCKPHALELPATCCSAWHRTCLQTPNAISMGFTTRWRRCTAAWRRGCARRRSTRAPTVRATLPLCPLPIGCSLADPKETCHQRSS